MLSNLLKNNLLNIYIKGSESSMGFMKRNIALLCIFYIWLVAFTGFNPVHALTASEYKGATENYSKVKGYQSEGENINFLSGRLSYEVTDAVIPGSNGMDIVISRSLNTSEHVWGFNGQIGSMSNWRLEVPRIIIPTVPLGITRGWYSIWPRYDETEYDKYIEKTPTTRTGICNDPYPGDGRASYLNSGGIKIAKKYWSGMKLKIPGHPEQQLFKNTDSARYPSVKWVTTSDWVATCTSDGNGFIVKSPQGITYTIDIVQSMYSLTGMAYQFNHTGNNTLFASKVSNVHGSEVTYEYETHGGLFMPKNPDGFVKSHFELPWIEQRLVSIKRDFDVNITIDYDTSLVALPGSCLPDGNCEEIIVTPAALNERIKTISIEDGSTLFYGYTKNDKDNRHYLTSFSKGDEKWLYGYSEDKKSYRDEALYEPDYYGPRLLTKVTLPGGGTIDYAYKAFSKLRNDPYQENIKLHTKTINDGAADIDTWTFNYEDTQHDSKDAIKVTTTRNLDTTVKIFSDDKSFQHGRLLKESTTSYDTSDTVSETKSITYTYALIADIGTFTFLDFPEDLPKSLTSKVKLTKRVVRQDANDYTTKYLTHDNYGRPTKIQETFNSKSKFTKRAYLNQTGSKWLLGLPTTVKVADEDVDTSYKTVSETVYHDATSAEGAYAELGLPYEQKQFGRWVKRFIKYDSKGNLEREEYNVARTQGEGNRFTEYSRYKHGIARTVTVPARDGTGNISMSRIVNDNGWITQETDLNGVVTKYSYHTSGNIKGVNYTKDSTTGNDWFDKRYTWDYTTTGSPTRTIQYCNLDNCEKIAGYTVTETYDGLMRLKTVEKTDGVDTRYKSFTYDKNNQQTLETFWSGSSGNLNGIGTTYDGLGRVYKVATSGLGEVAYDYLANNKVTVTDAKSYSTTKTYQAFGMPEYKSVVEIASPENITTTIDIDVFGTMRSIVQSGLNKDNKAVSSTQSLYYDTYNQLCLTVREDVGATAFSKNALGETNWTAQGVSYNAEKPACIAKPTSIAIGYGLDNLGEVKSITYPDTSGNVTYVKDNVGNITSLTAGGVIHTYTYNNQNLLKSETLNIDGYSAELRYKYDDFMHLNATVYPDGTEVVYQPNSFGEATEAQTYELVESTSTPSLVVKHSFARTASYHANGHIKAFTYGNGVKHTTELHTLSNLPKQIQDLDGTTSIVDLTYTFDSNANVSNITDALSSGSYNLTNMTYDGLDRLTSINAGTNVGGAKAGSTTIKYDGLGNIEQYTVSTGRDLTYTYENNRLKSVSGYGNKYSNFQYDTRGNVKHNGERSFVYNRANQLASSGTNTYVYDGFNRRVKQQDANGVSYSMYSQDGTLLYREKGALSGAGTNYIYLGQKLIAKYGDVTPQTVAQSRQHYRAFGETIETPKDDVGYTGHKFDTDLGLSYMQARYYDPVIGRFYSNDPVGYTSENPVMSFNRYLYVNNNPYKYTDPNGEFFDAVFDIGFIGYDLYDMAVNGVNATNSASLGANVAGLFIPGATGLGLGVRAADKGTDLAQAARRTCCFVAGTQVLTEDGYKNIENVKLDEKLWAKNTDTGEQDWKPVTKIFVEPDRGIYEVKLIGEDGFEQKIQATDDHPFFVIDKGWKQTIELEVGDKIETDGHGFMRVASVIDEKRLDLTYNFTVADFHTYYVTKKNVLVHNCNLGTKSVLTNKQAKKSAEGFGFKDVTGNVPKAVEKQVGRNPVYYDKKSKSYFSPDKAGHRADNAWKRFNSSGKRETGIFNKKGKFEKVSE
ncbi:RHS repeat-associated core domain-containing protein [Pseudoalteromonas aurantia]|uniref:Hint domain-containing protein n=1 Tax=Pseudoalteromonas aurantia 208 TaxID=1314867 RepID=A0ABR9EA94_9GAMM|nr:RHS repeat-associated core domain-containing protein [Pseudoalteromonas aurantia]MBE0367294.1 hypothetical protein [Pseudoalteromonas aurantia 208]